MTNEQCNILLSGLNQLKIMDLIKADYYMAVAIVNDTKDPNLQYLLDCGYLTPLNTNYGSYEVTINGVHALLGHIISEQLDKKYRDKV